MHVRKQPAEGGVLDALGAEKYLEHVLAISARWGPLRIVFAGPGEPTEHPLFGYMACSILRLSQDDLIVQTNLWRPERILELVRAHRDDPATYRRIHLVASYHLGTVLRDPNAHTRLRNNLLEVVDQGLDVTVVIPLAPNALHSSHLLRDVRQISQRARGTNSRLQFHLLELGHVLEGRRYPGAYSAEDREKLLELVEMIPTTRPIPKDPEVFDLMDRKLALCGTPCYASARTIKIGLTGNIWTCSAVPKDTTYLGSLDSPGIIERLYTDGPKLCPATACGCKAAATRYALWPANRSITDAYSTSTGRVFVPEEVPTQVPRDNIEP